MHSVHMTSHKASALAVVLEGLASLDARHAADLTDLFLETTRKAMERHIMSQSRH